MIMMIMTTMMELMTMMMIRKEMKVVESGLFYSYLYFDWALNVGCCDHPCLCLRMSLRIYVGEDEVGEELMRWPADMRTDQAG